MLMKVFPASFYKDCCCWQCPWKTFLKVGSFLENSNFTSTLQLQELPRGQTLLRRISNGNSTVLKLEGPQLLSKLTKPNLVNIRTTCSLLTVEESGLLEGFNGLQTFPFSLSALETNAMLQPMEILWWPMSGLRWVMTLTVKSRISGRVVSRMSTSRPLTLGCIHLTVNHSTNFVDLVTGANTNTIERTWTHAERGLYQTLQSQISRFRCSRNLTVHSEKQRGLHYGRKTKSKVRPIFFEGSAWAFDLSSAQMPPDRRPTANETLFWVLNNE